MGDKQTLRDLSVYKLVVACLCNDLSTMKDTIDILRVWPTTDQMLPRLYCRLFWVGIGAFILVRTRGTEKAKKENGLRISTKKSHSNKSNKSDDSDCYLELGNKYLDFFRDAADKGNPNAKACFLCMQAERDQSGNNYELAIEVCRKNRFKHFEAMMNEHCGLYKLEKKKKVIFKSEKKKQAEAATYLNAAISLYTEYGAVFKANEIKSNYQFL